MNELKPCPFCGAQPVVRTENLDERFGYANEVKIQCPSCGAAKSAMGDSSKGGYADNSTTEQRAIEAWNRRAAPADVGEDGQSAIWSAIENYAHASAVYAYSTTRADAAQQRQAKEDARADLRAQLAARGQGQPIYQVWNHAYGRWDDATVPEYIAAMSDYRRTLYATPQPAALQPMPGALNVLSVMLWLYQRLPRAYGRPPHIEQPILALAKRTGKDVSADLAERDPAPAQGDLQEKP